jgi:replicative DNA helicase
MFTDYECKRAYDVMQQLTGEGKKIDSTEVAMRLMNCGGNIGVFMMNTSYVYEMTRQRVELLRELLMKRQMYALGAKCMSLATDATTTADDFSELMQTMNGSVADGDDAGIQSFGETLAGLQGDVQERKDGTGEVGIMTGLHIFDSRWGWHTGDLIIIAGRTSQGKSTLATTIARNMALMGVPQAYYSLEMGSKQLTARIMARDVMIASSRLLYDKMNDDEFDKFRQNVERLKDLPIYYDDKSKTRFEKLCTSIRKMVRKHHIRVVYIDYLQILANGRNESREQLIGDMARDLKRLAVELNICVVAISQLSRSKDKPEPTLAEMRGSGQIEEACDTAVLVYRPYVYGIERYKDGTLTYGTAQLTIAKGRNIGLAQEVVSFDSELTYFHDISDQGVPKIQTQSAGFTNNDDVLPF